ncbi:MAG TPA: M50 family metallopeptidase [Symbiobacteriaceae bacterium]|nr:M50 family metallopeptidase [Symbiobacteriaceae bacterium]
MRLSVHWLFLVMLAVAMGAGYFAEAMILVGSLALHEIAHLAVAWVLGLQVEEVIITPFGGMAKLDTLVESDPQAETSIALAGPFQSFFLAGLMLFLSGDQLFDQRLVRFCFEVNANLAFFNLIPALPLDGGRALRGLMAQRFGYRRVTEWMALLGRFFGIAMAGAALLVWINARTLFVTPLVGGLFVAFGAGQEVANATYRSYRQFLRKKEQLKESRVLSARQLVAVEGTRLEELMEHLVLRRYHTVLVVDRNLQPLGTLYEAELMEAFQAIGPQATVEQILEM